MFTFFCVSATVGAVIATVQVVSALRGAPDALPLNDVATVSLLTENSINTHWNAMKISIRGAIGKTRRHDQQAG